MLALTSAPNLINCLTSDTSLYTARYRGVRWFYNDMIDIHTYARMTHEITIKAHT